MADYPMRTRLTRKGSDTELWFKPSQPEELFAPLAHSAATLLADVDHNRVRKGAQCVLHFQDTSKKGTRRWCSMQLCGNRRKVAAYAARQRMQPTQLVNGCSLTNDSMIPATLLTGNQRKCVSDSVVQFAGESVVSFYPAVGAGGP
jgi:hypothetical protein